MLKTLQEFLLRFTGQRPVVSESEIEDEIQFHIQKQTDELVRQGMTFDAARTEAMRQFGGVERVREEVRDTMRNVWLSDLFRDMKVALRSIARTPIFASTIVMILGLTICLAVTIFSFVHAILLRPLPFTDADRLVVIRSFHPDLELQMHGVSWADFFDWREQATSFEGIAAYRSVELDFTDGRSTQRYYGMSMTGNFFDVIGLPLAVGRSFTDDEVGTESPRLVLSRDLWKTRYQLADDVVGKTQDMYSWLEWPETGITRWEIVGAADRDIPFPPTSNFVGHTRGLNDNVQFWRPMWDIDKENRDSRYEHAAIARLKPGVSLETAKAEMEAISKRLADEYPETNRGWTTQLMTIDNLATARIRPALWLLVGAVGFLLVIACANVASLLIVRGIARQQEFAIRIAMGAGRWRLIRQLVTESLVLCLLGGVAGIVFAFWSIDVVRHFAPTDIPRIHDVSINWQVLGFALALSLTTGVVVGALPAFLSMRTSVNETLKAGGRTASASSSHRQLMNILVAGELAVSLVLLTGAVLLIRSFSALTNVDPGFRSENLLTMTVSLPEAKYEWKHNSDFCIELVEKLNAMPGIESASMIRGVPTQETHFDSLLHFEGRPVLPKTERPQGKIRVVDPGYFETMEIPLVAGRLFEPADSIGEVGHTDVVICNETFVQRFFPDGSPLGKRFTVLDPNAGMMEIVGIVGDVRYSGLRDEAHAEFYYPEALFPQAEFTLVMRTSGDPMTMSGPVENLVRTAEPDVIAKSPRPMTEVLSESLSRERFLMLLLSAFSIGAAVLAVTGNYTVMSYSVSQRRTEFGIRMALGASPGALVRKIVFDGLRLAIIGVAIGVAASLASSSLLRSEVFGIEPTDPATLAGVVTAMLLASAFASLIPSLRAAAISPAVALRGE